MSECIGCELDWEIVDGRHYADVYSEAAGRTDDIPCTADPDDETPPPPPRP